MSCKRLPSTRLRVLPLALGVVLAAAVPGAEEPRFRAQTSVVVVEVPVEVVHDGRPVRGLTAEQFEVFEGKQRQRVTGFEVIDLDALPRSGSSQSSPAPPPPLVGRRHFLFLFDLSFAQPRSILNARRAALDLARSGLHPSDLGAVATYSSSRGSELVLGFTGDRAQLAAAIESLGVPQLLARYPDPLSLVIGNVKAVLGQYGPRQAPRRVDKEADQVFLAILEDLQRVSSPERRALENQVVALTRSFSDLAQVMAAVDGRKHVVYLSEGFEAALTTGAGLDEESAAPILGNKPWKADSDAIFGSTRVQNDLVLMLEAMRRADCVIHAVDIGGVRAAGASAADDLRGGPGLGFGGRDSLLTMAHETGGELYQSFNDLPAAMAQMLARTSVTYVLSVEPEEPAADGAFHPLQVRLKGAPRGARVHHRAGYFATDPRRQPQELEQRLTRGAEILGGEEGGELPVSILAVPLSGSSASVPLWLEVDGPALLAGHESQSLELEIYAYALDREQAVRDLLTQRVELDLAKVAGELRARGLKFYGELELPPGAYTLRVLVEKKGGGRALRSLAIDVPPAGPGVSPPLFLESGGGWLLTRQARRPEDTGRDYPFLLDGQPLVPAARPRLAPEGAVRVALLAYDLAEELDARADVLRADGSPASTGGGGGGGGFHLLERQPGRPGEPDRLLGVFAPTGLLPGDYLLRVTLTGGNGEAARTSIAPFAVAAPG